MRVAFYVAEKDRNYGLAEAVAQGARVHGDEVVTIPQREFCGVRTDFDAAACLGVKRAGKRLLSEHLRAGQRFFFFDKAYMGRSRHVRVSLDSWQPLAYFQKAKRPPDRFRKLGVAVQGRQPVADGRTVMFAGSSQKYCNFFDLGFATEYAGRVIRKLRKNTRRPIVYRPKPSWAANHPDECKPIDGAEFSPPTRTISDELRRCHLLVTHGSNAAFDALAAGVPVMVLGEGICKPMSMGEAFGQTDAPWWPSDDARYQFFCDAAYCQWTDEELRSGEAWADLKRTLATLPAPNSGGNDSLEHLTAQYREMHAQPKYFRGRDAQKHFARIGKLVLRTGAKTLLDYGSGKGEQYQPPNSLQEAWDVEVKCYDPGLPQFEVCPPGPFDAVICCDVMEHIPERHVQTILRDAMSHATKFAFFSIATTPASKSLPDGRNCHLTLRPEEWWRHELEAARRAVAPGLTVEAWIQPDTEAAKPFPDDDE